MLKIKSGDSEITFESDKAVLKIIYGFTVLIDWHSVAVYLEMFDQKMEYGFYRGSGYLNLVHKSAYLAIPEVAENTVLGFLSYWVLKNK